MTITTERMTTAETTPDRSPERGYKLGVQYPELVPRCDPTAVRFGGMAGCVGESDPLATASTTKNEKHEEQYEEGTTGHVAGSTHGILQ
jgi:hypothetical protein